MVNINTVFLEVYTSRSDYQKSLSLKLPLESFITYSVYKYCSPRNIDLYCVYLDTKTFNEKETVVVLKNEDLKFNNSDKVPWQVSSCVYPVVMYDDTIITGLCAVARHISRYRSSPLNSKEHVEGLLGFRKSCLQAPNEVSIWTKFCEIDIIKTVKEIINAESISSVPQNLVRFENHLSKPVRVHNVYKMAREMKKMALKDSNVNKVEPDSDNIENTSDIRISKTRKWKSHTRKQLEQDSTIKIEDLDICHQFAEGPFLTLADIILMPSYYIILQSIGESVLQVLLPLTLKWFANIRNDPELESINSLMLKIEVKNTRILNLEIPTIENVSLYKCDPKRHNPKKRLFTKEDDIVNALHSVKDGMNFNIKENMFDTDINWELIPDCANPSAGHLPDERIIRKSQQLENLASAVLSIAKDDDLIVDFCSGSGHLGILIAHLLPKCRVILLENKEQSLLRARKRVQEANLTNVYFFQCNLDFFNGKFDIGVALHACGIASDLVLDKCLKANAKFVLCPCCYGSLHATDRLVYPRSKLFGTLPIDQYLCIGHAADQTHEEHPLTVRGERCMAVIDSDRGRLAEEFHYKVTLSRLKPLSCTPKNNLLIGVPC